MTQLFVTLLVSVPLHPKFLKAGPDASWLWICGLAYAKRHRTDGFIPETVLHYLGVKRPRPELLAARLVNVGLWDKVDDGWHVHDYLQHEHNKSADDLRALSATRSAIGRLGGRPRKSGAKQTKQANGKQTESKRKEPGKANRKQKKAREESREKRVEREIRDPEERSLLEDSKRSAATPTTHDALMTFPTIGKGARTWDLTQPFVDELQQLYPHVDVLQQSRQMLAWILTNTPKTARGMPAFVVRWLNKTANASSPGSRNSVNGSAPRTAAEKTIALMRELESERAARR